MNKPRPNIYLKRKASSSMNVINYTATCKTTHLSEKLCKDILHGYKVPPPPISFPLHHVMSVLGLLSVRSQLQSFRAACSFGDPCAPTSLERLQFLGLTRGYTSCISREDIVLSSGVIMDKMVWIVACCSASPMDIPPFLP